MASDVTRFVECCDVCQRTKERSTDTNRLGHIVNPSKAKPLEFWSVDIQGPFRTSTSGNRYIIVAIDYMTKYVEAACLKDCTAVSTAKFLVENIIMRHGIPKGMTLLSDQGSNFESKLIQELCELYSITKVRSSPYHPQGNGAVERENRSIKAMLRCYTLDDQSDWDKYLPQIIHARNTTKHASTGFSPHQMLYGKKPSDFAPMPDITTTSEYVSKLRVIREKIESKARDQLAKKQRANELGYNKRRPRARYQFTKGALVLLTNEATHPGLTKKLEPKFVGPFAVVKPIGSHNYQIRQVGSTIEKVVHHSRLVPYKRPSTADTHFLPATQPDIRPVERTDHSAITRSRYGREIRPVLRLQCNNSRVSPYLPPLMSLRPNTTPTTSLITIQP